MNTKQLIARFRAAEWRSEEEVARFAALAGEFTAAEVEKMLEIGVSRSDTPEQQHWRLAAFEKLAETVRDKSLFATYVKSLRTEDADLRAILTRLIPNVNNVTEHPMLVAMLRVSDPQIRKDVARILSSIGGRTVFDLLGDLAREPSFPGRMEVMEIVMEIAPQHSIPTLKAVIAAGNETEKAAAVKNLANPVCFAREPGEALRAVSEALGDSHENVAMSAITGIAIIGSEEDYFTHVGPCFSSKNLTIARIALSELRRFPSPRTVQALHRRVRSGPNVLRFAALDALEAIGTNDALDPLVEALGHTQIAVRTRAGEILMRLGQAGKIDLARTVIWLLRSRDVNVRRMAVELVQTVRDPDGELWPKLLGFLRDEDWWVRERVMDALVDMAGENLVRHLAGFLQDPSDLIRRFGVDALLRLRSPASLGTLLRTAASDPDWWVRERAIEAIAAIRDSRATPHVVDIMLKNPHLQVACLKALADLGAGEAAPQAASLLQSEDADVQITALQCLKRIGSIAQASFVQPLQRDLRPEVRSLARELVMRWGEAAGFERTSVEHPISFLDQMLVAVARAQGDDLILAPGHRPLMKRMGVTRAISSTAITPEKLKALISPHLSLSQLEGLETGKEVDFSYNVESENLRFRVNVFQQFGGIGVVFRIIKAVLPELEQLGIPPVVIGLADLTSGLVLVGGATGSGKSTTLAALVKHINRRSCRHIITLEDPIEVMHPRVNGIVNQREVGTHTGSFAAALRSTLRQDPNVILIGELRDLPTISFAVSAAETGHLVFGTIHTVSAAGVIDRLVNVYSPGQQDHVRSMLAGSLRAVVCQQLLPRIDARGRVLAVEVLLNNDAVANLIRNGKTYQIPSFIATSHEQGMRLMDNELLRLARDGVISADDAYARAMNKKDLEALVHPETSANSESGS
ncbi:MAG: PilT/PilU family type 4a pilus ATPase [Vicinamibacteria bacterium]|nr:PilT/PilU family type 4a pilus ATPase [Vicinamibacteria bacterium]